MSRKDGILHLVVYARIWDAIKAGRKPVEYRDIRWLQRIKEGCYTAVRIQRGFYKVNGVVPTMLFAIDHIAVGPADRRYVHGLFPADLDLVQIWLGERLGA